MLNKLREFPNPYDFANPVSDERLFVGRTTETADVIYYLNHAQKTQRPIHLAFVGGRAAGKTSFLNMAELEAKRRGFCTVRINLDEGDVESDQNFFRKLFNAVVMAAFASGAYGGKKSETFFSYLELTSTHTVQDKEKMPFVFGLLLANALKSGSRNVHVADDVLGDDLTAISLELKRPVVILMDECNVLRENRIILEKLRNVFMNLPGYMLVLAATEDFFPVMDDVFSPIMRQFKRIDIGPLKSDDDVRECIHKPLQNLGLVDNEVRQLAPRMFISDVDVLSGRRPYEVQLICHTLFRRCQEGSAKRFSLDLKTLESIQSQLASGQNVDARPVIRAAKSVRRKLFQALDMVCSSSEPLSADIDGLKTLSKLPLTNLLNSVCFRLPAQGCGSQAMISKSYI
jgi:hypothetical protein